MLKFTVRPKSWNVSKRSEFVNKHNCLDEVGYIWVGRGTRSRSREMMMMIILRLVCLLHHTVSPSLSCGLNPTSFALLTQAQPCWPWMSMIISTGFNWIFCISFIQDKIRLLSEDLETERELRQRVSIFACTFPSPPQRHRPPSTLSKFVGNRKLTRKWVLLTIQRVLVST